MPVSKAQQKAVGKYVKANYDLYQVKMPKGQKEIVQIHAADRGESINGFINRAIEETMEREKEVERLDNLEFDEIFEPDPDISPEDLAKDRKDYHMMKERSREAEKLKGRRKRNK